MSSLRFSPGALTERRAVPRACSRHPSRTTHHNTSYRYSSQEDCWSNPATSLQSATFRSILPSLALFGCFALAQATGPFPSFAPASTLPSHQRRRNCTMVQIIGKHHHKLDPVALHRVGNRDDESRAAPRRPHVNGTSLRSTRRSGGFDD